jgi:hypothetical protein
MNQAGHVGCEQGAVAAGRPFVPGGRGLALLPVSETPPLEAPATILLLTEALERWGEGDRRTADRRGEGDDGVFGVVEEPWQRAEREQRELYG